MCRDPPAVLCILVQSTYHMQLVVEAVLKYVSVPRYIISHKCTPVLCSAKRIPSESIEKD